MAISAAISRAIDSAAPRLRDARGLDRHVRAVDLEALGLHARQLRRRYAPLPSRFIPGVWSFWRDWRLTLSLCAVVALFLPSIFQEAGAEPANNACLFLCRDVALYGAAALETEKRFHGALSVSGFVAFLLLSRDFFQSLLPRFFLFFFLSSSSPFFQ